MNNSMSQEKIQKLLAVFGTRPQDDNSPLEYSEYNWAEPHYFNNTEHDKLNIFVQKLALAISKKFTDLCKKTFESKITSLTQHYASEFINESNNDTKNYYLTFGSSSNRQAGLLEIPDSTAIFWAKQLLGDSDSNENSERELSELELSLLYDISNSIVNVLSTVDSKISFFASGSIHSGSWPLDLAGTDELCKISFSVTNIETNQDSKANIIIPSMNLEPIAEKNTKSNDNSQIQDYSNIILEHLGFTPVRITAQLAESRLSFQGMMDLQVNDIIMLNKSIDEPIELYIDNNLAGFGHPAQSEGHFAVAIETMEL